MKIHIVNEYVIFIQYRKHEKLLNQNVTNWQKWKKMKTMTPSIIIEFLKPK
jgi:hypothetical protein